MTTENYGCLWEIDPRYPLLKRNLSNEKEMYSFTHYSNLRPIHCSENKPKGSKINHHLYLPQGIKQKDF